MELLSQQQLQQVSSAVQGLNHSQLAWVSGYLSGLSTQKNNVLPAPFEQATAQRITILYGSQTGNSKHIAEELHSNLLASGSNVALSNLVDYRPAQLKKEQRVIFVISTQGNGEPPDEALSFFQFIEGERAPKLAGLEFAVLGLGDSSYDDYCETGIVLDKRLTDLGASRFIDRVDVDIDFEEDAAMWHKNVVTYLKDHADSQPDSVIGLQQPNTLPSQANKWTESNPYQAEVLELIELTTDESEQQTYHLELSLEDYGQSGEPSYQSGDILAVLPENSPTLVNDIIEKTGLESDDKVEIKSTSYPLIDALLKKRELTKITRKVLKDYAELVQSEKLAELLEDKQASEDFIYGSDVLDLLSKFPATGKIEAQAFVGILRPLISRQYSIASSAKAHEDEVHLLVKPVVYDNEDREHLGVASNWLKQQEAGNMLSVHIKENSSFKLPEDPSAKIIMVGAGTGIAPFRGFLFDREDKGITGNSWLFFGEQHFKSDFLYQTDWQRFLKNDVLERFNVAFSRDQKEKIYVQHKLLEEAETLYQWLQAGAYFYVCGDINRMAADVHQALIQVIVEQSAQSAEQAEAYLDRLKREKRYQRDVY